MWELQVCWALSFRMRYNMHIGINSRFQVCTIWVKAYSTRTQIYNIIHSVSDDVVIAESVGNTSYANSVVVTSVSVCLYKIQHPLLPTSCPHLPMIPSSQQSVRRIKTMVNQSMTQIIIGNFDLIRFDREGMLFCGTGIWLWYHTS